MHFLDIDKNTALEYLKAEYIKGTLNKENQWEISKTDLRQYLIKYSPLFIRKGKYTAP